MNVPAPARVHCNISKQIIEKGNPKNAKLVACAFSEKFKFVKIACILEKYNLETITKFISPFAYQYFVFPYLNDLGDPTKCTEAYTVTGTVEWQAKTFNIVWIVWTSVFTYLQILFKETGKQGMTVFYFKISPYEDQTTQISRCTFTPCDEFTQDRTDFSSLTQAVCCEILYMLKCKYQYRIPHPKKVFEILRKDIKTVNCIGFYMKFDAISDPTTKDNTRQSATTLTHELIPYARKITATIADKYQFVIFFIGFESGFEYTLTFTEGVYEINIRDSGRNSITIARTQNPNINEYNKTLSEQKEKLNVAINNALSICYSKLKQPSNIQGKSNYDVVNVYSDEQKYGKLNNIMDLDSLFQKFSTHTVYHIYYRN